MDAWSDTTITPAVAQVRRLVFMLLIAIVCSYCVTIVPKTAQHKSIQ